MAVYLPVAAPRTVAVLLTCQWSRGKSGRRRAARLVKNEGQLVQASWTESAAENIPPTDIKESAGLPAEALAKEGKGEKVG